MPLKSINKQMKIDINEASGISDKCKTKLIRLVEKHFMVSLPKENYLNVDIEVLSNGNIKMRDIEYKTSDPIKTVEELENRFALFQEDVDILLDKNEVSFDTLTRRKERNNLIWVIFITFACIVILLNSLRELLSGNILGVLWFIIIIAYYIIPGTGTSIRNKYVRAYHYIKSLIYKNKN